jgi:hypothetical protein
MMEHSNYSILLSVSETLKELFVKNHPPSVIPLDPSSIVFDSPADIEGNNTSKLLIYLHQVSENADLVNAPVEMSRQISTTVSIRRKPPQPVDLHYLIVPYGMDRAAEIIMIQWVLDVLYDNSIIDPTYYQGALKVSDNNGNQIKVIQTPLSMNNLNDLWSLFSHTDFKLSLSYMVTPIFLPTIKEYEAHRVIQTEVTMVEKLR